MPLIQVTEVEDPRIAVFRDLRSSAMERRRGLFIAESMWLVRRLLASRFAVHSILLDERRLAEIAVPIPEQIPVYCTPDGLVEQVVGFKFHRGIVAAGIRRPQSKLTDLPGLAAERWLLVVCAGVQDPENVGNILRSSAALGATAAVVGPESADPFSRRVLRVSMGASMVLPIAESLDVFTELAALRTAYRAEVIATTLRPDAEPLAQARRSSRMVLVFGSEGHGLDAAWDAFCDRRITIPMDPRADSLNVAVASGIFLHHFLRHA